MVREKPADLLPIHHVYWRHLPTHSVHENGGDDEPLFNDGQEDALARVIAMLRDELKAEMDARDATLRAEIAQQRAEFAQLRATLGGSNCALRKARRRTAKMSLEPDSRLVALAGYRFGRQAVCAPRTAMARLETGSTSRSRSRAPRPTNRLRNWRKPVANSGATSWAVT
jgi:hypothetical protein